MTGGMTLAQAKALGFLHSYQETHGGASPSYAEIGKALGLASKSGVHRLMYGLADRGAIRVMPGRARSITIVERA